MKEFLLRKRYDLFQTLGVAEPLLQTLPGVKTVLASTSRPALHASGSRGEVGMPHEKWGETPCCFYELKPGCKAPTEEELKARPRFKGVVGSSYCISG